jgi:chloramphenicol 3-O phosphotransferase
MSALHRPGRVILLNGASSSGKTSLVKELQRVAAELQFLHLQLDTFRSMEPAGYWSNEQSEHRGRRVEALCRAMNSATVQFVKMGQNVVVDHVLTPQATKYLLEDLGAHEVLFIKVECSLEELESREARRPERTLGLARSQLHSVHKSCAYDYVVNTTARPSLEMAEELAAWLRTWPVPEAFPHMCARNAA